MMAKLELGILLIIAALFCASAAKADTTAPSWETFTFDDGALSISNQPCTVPKAMERWERIRVNIKAQYDADLGPVLQSRLLWKGRVYAGCYAIGPDTGYVYNIDSTGVMLEPGIPRRAFVPHEGALPTGAVGT